MEEEDATNEDKTDAYFVLWEHLSEAVEPIWSQLQEQKFIKEGDALLQQLLKIWQQDLVHCSGPFTLLGKQSFQ